MAALGRLLYDGTRMSVEAETDPSAVTRPREEIASKRRRVRLRRLLTAIGSRFSSSLTRRILVLNLVKARVSFDRV